MENYLYAKIIQSDSDSTTNSGNCNDPVKELVPAIYVNWFQSYTVI